MPRRQRSSGSNQDGSGRSAVVSSGSIVAAAGEWVTLDESYEICRELNRRYGTTYYWSAHLLPAVKRPHVHALYGFCRYADDIVDDLGSTATIE